MFLNFLVDNGFIKQWHEFKTEHNLHESFYFQRLQLIESIPQRRKISSKKTMKMLLILSFMTII